MANLSSFSRFVIPERVDRIIDTPPYIGFSNPRYSLRLEQEISEVEAGGFWQPLCFAAEVVRLARLDPPIPYVCRGSAGSSLLCYLAAISDVDPVEAGLGLERFLSKGRDKPPDIDLDFPAELRSALWERVRGRFGDQVGFVATRLRYRERGALREALRRCGVSYELWVSPMAVIPESRRHEVMTLAKSLEGKVYGLARHCGGIVIFPDEVPSHYRSARLKEPFAQLILDKQDLEKRGIGKLDILANKGLSHLSAMGLENTLGRDCEDPDAGKIFSQGNTWGIVQGESPAMRKIFSSLRISNLEGVILSLGLVRPATGGGVINSKPSPVGRNPIERRLIYEDDITEFLSVILGASPSLAEHSRRVLAKGGEEARKLLANAEKIVNRKGREKINFRGKLWSWSEIKKQLGLASSYAFCKAHATAYGRVVWALGLAKARNPRLFWETFIPTAMASSMYLPWVHFERVKKDLGVKVLWPGDFSLPVGYFFKVPWAITESVAGPVLGRSSCYASCEFPSVFGNFADWDLGSNVWKRQLVSAGFWAGDKGLIPQTYGYQEKDGIYHFNGLRALKSPRIHPLDKERVCLFETLGYGSSKILEYTRVFERQSQKVVGILDDKESVFVSGSGVGCELGDAAYVRPKESV